MLALMMHLNEITSQICSFSIPKLLFGFIVLLISFSTSIEDDFSANSGNLKWCFFQKQNELEIMSSCKFRCWSGDNAHLGNFTQRQGRQFIVSLSVQITAKNCTANISEPHLRNLTRLRAFHLTGFLSAFNLTYLVQSAPHLEKLMLYSMVLLRLDQRHLPTMRLRSLSLMGVFDPGHWLFLSRSATTIESVSIILNRKVVTPVKLFSAMPKLRYVFLQILFEKINKQLFDKLPLLEFISINNNYMHYPVVINFELLSDLPSLRTMKVFNLDIREPNGSGSFCRNLSQNINHFMLEMTSLVFVERCMDIWICIECGSDDIEQVMEFKHLLNIQSLVNRLDQLQPVSPLLLNTSQILLLDTHIRNITGSSLARMPLLRRYYHHRAWSSTLKGIFSDIDNITGNPFEYLAPDRLDASIYRWPFNSTRSGSRPGQLRLQEVRLSIVNCDCNSYVVYQFLMTLNVTVRFFCHNLAVKYPRMELDNWIRLQQFHDIMYSDCNTASDRHGCLALFLLPVLLSVSFNLFRI